MRRVLVIGVMLSCLPILVMAGNEDRIGTAGGTQLLINPWARSSALASSNVATVNGIEGAFINVGGLAFTRKTELMFTNTDWMSGSDIAINGNTIQISDKVIPIGGSYRKTFFEQIDLL